MSTSKFAEQLVTNKNGRKYWIYKDDVFYQQRIAGAGPYQKKNLIRLRDLRPNARTVIDVGANIGIYTVFSAKVSKVKVYSFEPEAGNFQILIENIISNKQMLMLKATVRASKDYYRFDFLGCHQPDEPMLERLCPAELCDCQITQEQCRTL